MLTFALLALWCTLLIAPETPIGRSIGRWMVEKPAARLNRITRGQVLLVLLLVSGAMLVGWLMGHESVRLMAMGLPDVMAWATMFEITAYLDAIAAVVTAASAMRIDVVRTRLRSLVGRRPRLRSPRPRPARKAANDDEDRAAVRAA